MIQSLTSHAHCLERMLSMAGCRALKKWHNMSRLYWSLESERQAIQRHTEIFFAANLADQDLIHSSIARIRESLKRQDMALITLLDEALDHPRSADAFRRVFQLAELRELVLPKLGAKDLLHLMQVCQLFRGSIEGSIRLRRRLQLQTGGHTTKDWTTLVPLARLAQVSLFVDAPCLSLVCSDTRAVVGKPAKGLIFGFGQDKLPRIGARCLQMHVCNPPVYRLHLALVCWKRSTARPDLGTIKTEDGIRVQDLVHAL